MNQRTKILEFTSSFAKSFALQLKAERTRQGISIVTLASKSLVSSRIISKIENNETHLPELFTIASLSVALDFYEWEFFTLTRF